MEIKELIFLIGSTTSMCGVLIISASLTLVVIKSISDWWYNKKQKTYECRINSKINRVSTWCSYDFPIVEDICDYLRDGDDINQFRSELYEKYRGDK